MTREEALEASIKHWEENLAAELPIRVKIYSPDCALCTLYLGDNCEGCPVFERTGKKECADTPWSEAAKALQRWCIYKSMSGHPRAEFRKAAQAEVNFLKSLRKEQPQ